MNNIRVVLALGVWSLFAFIVVNAARSIRHTMEGFSALGESSGHDNPLFCDDYTSPESSVVTGNVEVLDIEPCVPGNEPRVISESVRGCEDDIESVVVDLHTGISANVVGAGHTRLHPDNKPVYPSRPSMTIINVAPIESQMLEVSMNHFDLHKRANTQPNDVAVFSDIDDTLISTGNWKFGISLGGYDQRLGRGVHYPGIGSLLLTIAEGSLVAPTDSPQFHLNFAPNSRTTPYPIIILTARLTTPLLKKIQRPNELVSHIAHIAFTGSKFLSKCMIPFGVGGENYKGLCRAFSGSGPGKYLTMYFYVSRRINFPLLDKERASNVAVFGDNGHHDVVAGLGMAVNFPSKIVTMLVHLVKMPATVEDLPKYFKKLSTSFRSVVFQALQLDFTVVMHPSRIKRGRSCMNIDVGRVLRIATMLEVLVNKMVDHYSATWLESNYRDVPPPLFVKCREVEGDPSLDPETMRLLYHSDNVDDTNLGVPFLYYRTSVGAAIQLLRTGLIDIRRAADIAETTLTEMRDTGPWVPLPPSSEQEEYVQKLLMWKDIMYDVYKLKTYAENTSEYTRITNMYPQIQEIVQMMEYGSAMEGDYSMSLENLVDTDLPPQVLQRWRTFSTYIKLHSTNIKYIANAGQREFENITFNIGHLLHDFLSDSKEYRRRVLDSSMVCSSTALQNTANIVKVITPSVFEDMIRLTKWRCSERKMTDILYLDTFSYPFTYRAEGPEAYLGIHTTFGALDVIVKSSLLSNFSSMPVDGVPNWPVYTLTSDWRTLRSVLQNVYECSLLYHPPLTPQGNRRKDTTLGSDVTMQGVKE